MREEGKGRKEEAGPFKLIIGRLGRVALLNAIDWMTVL